MPFEAVLLKAAEAPAYQRIAQEAEHLQESGLSMVSTARQLGVTDKTDPRTGRNLQSPLPDLFRPSLDSRLAGYEDTNDAERLAATTFSSLPKAT